MTTTLPFMTLAELEQAAPESLSTSHVLTIAHCPDHTSTDRRIALSAREICLGREPNVTGAGWVVLRDPRVSRLHATLTWQEEHGQLLLADCSSRNGVFVNGRRVERQLVGVGDVIRVGDSLLLLCGGEPQDDDDDTLGMVARSPGIYELRKTIRRVAPSGLSVLIVGATGAGKELVARALHALSGRRGPFLAVNCAALPGTLVENALFGHRRGAYTDATSDQDGAFVQAHGGTLFLDEIGDLSLEAQPKLLRVLDNAEVAPIGAAVPVGIDVRIVVATHVPLDAAMKEARFREDLYGRLAGVVIKVPSLAERREDILPLLRHFLPPALRTRPMTTDFVESLLLYSWPRNVRQLQKLAERLPVLYPDASSWDLGMLDEEARIPARDELPPDEPPPVKHLPSRDEVVELLERCAGNVSQAAKLAQRSRKQFYRWMERYGVARGVGRTHD